MADHRESPTKRTNPSGETVWVARYTDPRTGERLIAKPGWNRGKGTFNLRREAQRAIDEAYEIPSSPETLGAYAGTWTELHPRSARTNATNDHRISRVLDVKIEGRRLRDWPYRELKRKHAAELVRVLLVDQGRARDGAVGILRTLSAMTEDAITDELAEVNAFKGVRVKSNDPRIQKAAREPQVFSFEQLHAFAAAGRAIRSFPNSPARNYEALLRTFTDTGARLGEVLALERRQLVDGVLHLEGTAHKGVVTGDTETKRHTRLIPATDELLELIAAQPPRIDTRFLFPAPRGRLWRERNFYREVWYPARVEWARQLGADVEDLGGEQLRQAIAAVGADITPHDCRHSWVTHLAAAGVDEADLCEIAGHGPETMRKIYRHPLRRSFDQVRQAIR